MKRPRKLVRPNELEPYFPLKRTARKNLVKQLTEQGVLKKVILRPGGRAVAYTEDSVIKAQTLMGLSAKGGSK